MDVICNVEECSNSIKPSYKFCSLHVSRFYRYGTPTPLMCCSGCNQIFNWLNPAIFMQPFCENCAYVFTIAEEYIPPKSKRMDLSKHKITLFQYLSILIRQNFCCAICDKSLPKISESNRRPHLDHDHKCCFGGYSCGECIRGILCPKCNIVVHHFEVNGHLFEKVGLYLDRK